MGLLHSIGHAIGSIANGISNGISSIAHGIGNFASGLWDAASHLANGIWDSISSVAKKFGQAVADVVKYASKLTDKLCNAVKSILENTWEFTKDAVEGIIVEAGKILDAVVNFIKEFELKIWDGLCLLGYLEKAILSFQEKISSEINNMLECTNEYYTPVYLESGSTVVKSSVAFCLYYDIKTNSCSKGKTCGGATGNGCTLYTPNENFYTSKYAQMNDTELLKEINDSGSVISLFNKG